MEMMENASKLIIFFHAKYITTNHFFDEKYTIAKPVSS
jgi:hypothetical protein